MHSPYITLEEAADLQPRLLDAEGFAQKVPGEGGALLVWPALLCAVLQSYAGSCPVSICAGSCWYLFRIYADICWSVMCCKGMYLPNTDNGKLSDSVRYTVTGVFALHEYLL